MEYAISLRVNGEERRVTVPAGRLLVDCLRYDLGLTGTKETCGVGVCGACTVVLNGRPVASCLTLAVACDGAEVVTVEGLAPEGRLHPVQEAFVRQGGFQCGACTPGQVVAAWALLQENPNPSDEEIQEWLMGNLCRCTGYYGILRAVREAAGRDPDG